MSKALQARANPYVGPRSFRRGEKLYGRDREVVELLDLLIAERIVLLYSPSGAGKTSLIQAVLVSQLEREGFEVLPVMRVGLEPPPNLELPQASNRYVLSLLLSLERELPAEEQMPLAALAVLTLEDYLQHRQAAFSTTGGLVLIFDQFEEILTVDPTNRPAKRAFFTQVGAALRNRELWALFAMREEFLAGLDPYLRPVPTRLTMTYRLEFLEEEGARQAIRRPARDAGIDFADGAATKLVDDLRRVRVQQPDGHMKEELGPYVEPVQLQVVCRRLWDRLPADTTQIVVSHLGAIGDVDTALAGYYAERVAAVATKQAVPERAIRDWFDRRLITEYGIRGQVLQGPERSEGLPNQAIWPLVDAHLVRAEQRRGAIWFELAHDRLIDPIREDNSAWRERALSTLQRQADLWNKAQRPEGLLLHGEDLVNAERWLQDHAYELEPFERDFLDRSRTRQKVVKRQRILAVGLAVMFVLAVLAAFFAWIKAGEAVAARKVAEQQQGTAVALLNQVRLADLAVTSSWQTAVALQIDVATARAQPDLQVGTLEALSAASTAAIAAQQTAEAQRGTVVVAVITVVPPSETPAPSDGPSATPSPTVHTPIIVGSSISRLTDDPAQEYVASYSPDGRYIAYMSDRDGSWQIYLMNVDGSGAHRLTTNDADNHKPRFSPDGQQLVFVSKTEGDFDLYLMALEGQHVRRLIDLPGDQTSPSFSPDGQSIVFVDSIEKQYDIFLTDVTGSFLQNLTAHPANDVSPAFAPDGQHLVFQSDRDGNWEIYALNLDSGEVRRLTHDRSRDAEPAVSPDGRWIVFESKRSGNYDLYMMDWDGGQLRRLTTDPAADQVPAFSPDGSGIIFQSKRAGGVDLYTLPLAAAMAMPTVAVTQEAMASPTPSVVTARVNILDDFESYSGSTALRAVYDVNDAGGANSGELLLGRSPHVDSGRKSAALHYDIKRLPPADYVGVERRFSAQNWQGFETLDIWIEGGGPDVYLTIQFGESSQEVWRYETTLPTDAVHEFSLTLDQDTFSRADWSPRQNDRIDLDAIDYYAIFVARAEPGMGVIYVDDVVLK